MRFATVLACSLLMMTSAGATPQEEACQAAAKAAAKQATDGGSCCSQSKTAATVSLDGKLARIFADGPTCGSAAGEQPQPGAALALRATNVQGKSTDDGTVAAREILTALGYTNASGGDRGYMGVYMEVSDGVMVVNNVMAGAPAEKAGLQAGDRVLKVAGHEVQGMEALTSFLATLEAGKEIELLVQRDGKERELTLTLVPRESLELDIESGIEELLSDLEEDAQLEDPDVIHGFLLEEFGPDRVHGKLSRIRTRSGSGGDHHVKIVIDGKVIDLEGLAEIDLSDGPHTIEVEVESSGGGRHTIHTTDGSTIEIHTGHGDSENIIVEIDGTLDDETMSKLRDRIRSRVKREIRVHGDGDHDVSFFGGDGEHADVHDFTVEGHVGGHKGLTLRRWLFGGDGEDGHEMIFGFRDDDDDDHDVRVFRLRDGLKGLHGLKLDLKGLKGLKGLEGLGGLGDEIRELIHEHLGDLHRVKESDGHDRTLRRVRIDRETDRRSADDSADNDRHRDTAARDEIDALRAEIRDLRKVIEDLREVRVERERSRSDRRELDQIREDIRALLESLEDDDR